ncbi:MAG: hypothetical protein ABL907_03260 [Hyphomicrobium sp.]
MRLSHARYISILGTEVHAAVTNPAEGKVALKEIKQKKSEFGLKRRALLYHQKQAKAAADRAEGSAPRKTSTGMVAMLRRLFAKAKARKPRQCLADLETEIQTVDEILFNLDSCRVQIEGKLLHMGPGASAKG